MPFTVDRWVSGRRLKSWSALVVAAIFFAGCASEPKHKVVLTGNVLVDGPNEIASGPPRDRVLWQYRTAVAEMRQGKFDEAKHYLDDALVTLGGIFGPDAEARKARGYFHAEEKKTFIGEPYERSMAYFYRGIIYWIQGEPDNARACFRSAEFEDADAEKKEFAGDWVLPDYLDGLITSRLGGDGGDAFNRSVANSSSSRPGSLGIKLPPYPERANVFLLIEFGQGPIKYSTGRYGEELRFRTVPSVIVQARVKTGTINLPVAPCDDVDFQATTRGGRIMDHILGHKAVFKTTTDTIGNVAIAGGLGTAIMSGDQTAQQVGLGIALAGLVTKLISAAATPQADIRSWDDLPQYISFATLTLPPGLHTMTVEFMDRSGQTVSSLTKSITFEVKPSDTEKVIFVSDQNATPQTL